MSAPEDDPDNVGSDDAKAAGDKPATENKPKRARRKPAASKEAGAAKAKAADKPKAAAKAKAADKPKAAPKAKAADKPKAAAATQATDEPAAGVTDEAPQTAAAETPKPRRTRRKAASSSKVEPPAAPAARAQRPSRDHGDTPPMVRAHAKYVRTSARKARLVCDHIRGKSVEEARAILAHASRDVARDWSKLLESAVANAEHNHELIGDELRIAAIKADEGPTLKRFRPRAMGRATKIRKRTSHLSITLTPKDGE
jgi:ribosomal protein L22